MQPSNVHKERKIIRNPSDFIAFICVYVQKNVSTLHLKQTQEITADYCRFWFFQNYSNT